MYDVIHFYLFRWKQISAGFLNVSLYLYFRWRSIYQERYSWDPIDRFNSATYVCLSQDRICNFQCQMS